MKKYQVRASFAVTPGVIEDQARQHKWIADHITDGTIDFYGATVENSVWFTINAEDRQDLFQILRNAPYSKYWTVKVEELFVYDGQLFRFPAFQLN